MKINPQTLLAFILLSIAFVILLLTLYPYYEK